MDVPRYVKTKRATSVAFAMGGLHLSLMDHAQLFVVITSSKGMSNVMMETQTATTAAPPPVKTKYVVQVVVVTVGCCLYYPTDHALHYAAMAINKEIRNAMMGT